MNNKLTYINKPKTKGKTVGVMLSEDDIGQYSVC